MARRRTWLAASLATLALMVAALAAAVTAGKAQREPIIIGAAVARTGIMSQFDIPELQGL